MTRTATRAGREGAASERKSRTAPLWLQYGQPSGSDGPANALASATGASHSGQASVPVARWPERIRRSSLSCSGRRSKAIGSV